MIRIKADSVSISANAKEALVAEFTPPKDKKYQFLEIALKAVGAGYFSVYYNQERICDKIEKDALTIDERRILIDWELQYGDKVKIVFTDTSGATNTARYIVVYKQV